MHQFIFFVDDDFDKMTNFFFQFDNIPIWMFFDFFLKFIIWLSSFWMMPSRCDIFSSLSASLSMSFLLLSSKNPIFISEVVILSFCLSISNNRLLLVISHYFSSFETARNCDCNFGIIVAMTSWIPVFRIGLLVDSGFRLLV